MKTQYAVKVKICGLTQRRDARVGLFLDQAAAIY